MVETRRARREMEAAKHKTKEEELTSSNIVEKDVSLVESLREDAGGIVLLLLLYTLQGIPMGLSGSIPFILQQQKVSYQEQAIFNLVSWPFSLKLLWAPLVDAVFHAKFGRRKSWLGPTQLLTGVIMVFMSTWVDELLGFKGEMPAVRTLTMLFFVLYFMMATQDIAVDGWALTILSERNVGFAATCNTVGQTLGYFISYVGFLAMNDAPTCNRYFRSAPSEAPMVTLPQFLFFWGIVFIFTTLLVMIFKSEKVDPNASQELGVRETYKTLWAVLQLPPVRSVCLVLATCKMGFAAADNITSLKFVEFGFPKEEMALMSSFLIPVGIIIPIVVSKFIVDDPMSVFMKGVPLRVLVGLLYVVMLHQAKDTLATTGGVIPSWLYFSIVGSVILHEVASNMMFVAQISFFNRVSDESIGGTYMTLLNTVGNFGSKWPASLVMFLVDPLTTKSCSASEVQGACGSPEYVAACTKGGGKCSTLWDGYDILAAVSTVLAIAWYFAMRHRVQRLACLTKDKWEVPKL